MGDTVEAAMTMGWGGDEQEAATGLGKASLTAATSANTQGTSATCSFSNARNYDALGECRGRCALCGPCLTHARAATATSRRRELCGWLVAVGTGLWVGGCVVG